jgi:hypothetical protein
MKTHGRASGKRSCGMSGVAPALTVRRFSWRVEQQKDLGVLTCVFDLLSNPLRRSQADYRS